MCMLLVCSRWSACPLSNCRARFSTYVGCIFAGLCVTKRRTCLEHGSQFRSSPRSSKGWVRAGCASRAVGLTSFSHPRMELPNCPEEQREPSLREVMGTNAEGDGVFVVTVSPGQTLNVGGHWHERGMVARLMVFFSYFFWFFFSYFLWFQVNPKP